MLSVLLFPVRQSDGANVVKFRTVKAQETLKNAAALCVFAPLREKFFSFTL